MADYERGASLAAKEPAPSKTTPKAAAKNRDEPAAELRANAKAAEREPPVAAAREERVPPGRAGHKAAQKGHDRDEPPAEQRQSEPDNGGCTAASVVIFSASSNTIRD